MNAMDDYVSMSNYVVKLWVFFVLYVISHVTHGMKNAYRFRLIN